MKKVSLSVVLLLFFSTFAPAQYNARASAKNVGGNVRPPTSAPAEPLSPQDSITIKLLSAAQPPEENVNVFPNPSNGNFTFSHSGIDSTDITLIISNVLGQKVKELSASANSNTDVKLREASGIYFLTASRGRHRVHAAKILIE